MIFRGGLSLILASTLAQADDAPQIAYPDLPAVAASANEFIAPGWVAVSTARGDLNRDGRSDLALALWPRTAAESDFNTLSRGLPPYRLVIAFADANGRYRLVADERSLIEPPSSSGAYEAGLDEAALNISKGSLSVYRELLRGHYRYRFRWEGRDFRLIGYDSVVGDGACITKQSVNFLTRRAIVEVMANDGAGSGEHILRLKRQPLPTFGKVASLELWNDNMGIVGNYPSCPAGRE